MANKKKPTQSDEAKATGARMVSELARLKLVPASPEFAQHDISKRSIYLWSTGQAEPSPHNLRVLRRMGFDVPYLLGIAPPSVH